MSDLLTVKEVAALLNCSEETVARRFSDETGVIDLGSGETMRRRRYRVLRIPTSVVEKYLRKRGGRVTVPLRATPTEKKKPKTSLALDEDELVRQLAAVTRQSGLKARKTLDDIAERARILTLIPEDRWSEIVWFSEE